MSSNIDMRLLDIVLNQIMIMTTFKQLSISILLSLFLIIGLFVIVYALQDCIDYDFTGSQDNGFELYGPGYFGANGIHEGECTVGVTWCFDAIKITGLDHITSVVVYWSIGSGQAEFKIGNADADFNHTIFYESGLTSDYPVEFVDIDINLTGSYQYFYFHAVRYSGATGPLEVQEIDICGYYEEGGASCTTVNDHHFMGVITDAWLLSGSATISDSILTLTAGDAAGQNLTLASNTAYNAVISVTEPLSDLVNLNIVLGTDTQTMTITTTGYYSASFTTPNLGGTLGYVIQNGSPLYEIIYIDYTCLLRADGEEDTICLAPPNGEFETAAEWGWYRASSWQNPAKNAFLPYPEAGLIQPTTTFTLPSLGIGEYLILGFDAHSEQNNAVIGGQVVSGTSDVTFYYETFPIDYRFETDLSLLAGGSSANLSLVNASLYAEEALSETVGVDDIIIDNVCIFVSDEPPGLPSPLEDSGAWSVNFGYNYTSCADIDGIWSYFGVNMAQYRSDYYAGATVWDPVGWVPWLVSAFWVIIGSLGCMLLSIYLGLLHTLEYFLNNFLNYAFWFFLSTLGFIDWLGDWFYWGWASLWNIIQAYFPWLGDALLWLWGSLGNISSWWYLTFGGFIIWLALWLLNLNGVRDILNILIAAWNLFLGGIGVAIGGIIQTGVDLWNNYIAPFLSSFSLITWILALFLTLAAVGFDWVWTVLQWLWANVISVGTIPLSFYYAFDDGLNSSAYDALVSCAGVNFWCAFLAGVQLINQIIAHSILYPIVITGIILSTIVILWINIKELFFIDLKIR